MTGDFTISGALGNNLNGQAIAPTSFSFTDGLANGTVSNANVKGWADGRWHVWHNLDMTEAAERSGLLRSLRLDLENVEAGVPVETITNFVLASGFELRDIYVVVIPARTLKHRRSRKQPLSPDESDRLARFVRIFDQAVTVFGDAEQARRWLSKPMERFSERTPLQMLRTDFGGRTVEEMLGQIDEGMFA